MTRGGEVTKEKGGETRTRGRKARESRGRAGRAGERKENVINLVANNKLS